MSDVFRRQSGPFREGDRVQLTGPKGRLNTVTLEVGGAFHTHRGVLSHDLIIGQPDASVVTSTNDIEYLAMRPLLTDFVMSMPRGAAIIYPKDAAQIIGQADIFPGAHVVEAGVGSGALSLWLLRAIGSSGTLSSFERREEFSEIAQSKIFKSSCRHPSKQVLLIGSFSTCSHRGSALKSAPRLSRPVESYSVTLRPSLSCRVSRKLFVQRDCLPSLIQARLWCADGTLRVSPFAPPTAWSLIPVS